MGKRMSTENTHKGTITISNVLWGSPAQAAQWVHVANERLTCGQCELRCAANVNTHGPPRPNAKMLNYLTNRVFLTDSTWK